MTEWFRKLLGYHVCEDFTAWERKTQEIKIVRIDPILGQIGPIEGTQVYQERRCKACGRIFQKELKF
ncbi:MAG: hypothetical protein ACYCQK_01260 [Acidiferrobacteraceae bacterium]